MKAEFDDYIDQYRENLDLSLSLSGESSTYFAKLKAEKLKEWLPAKRATEQTILDFGCGDGMMTNFVQYYFPKAKLYGCDPSSESIEVAKQQYQHITFAVNSENDTKLPFENNIFDVVLAAGAFHHIPFSMHVGYLEEINRILKPQGTLVVFELNPLNPLTVLTFKRNPIDKNAKMLFPWYSYTLFKKYGKTNIKFYCFFPKFLSWLRWTEPYLTKFPIAALYAIIMQKK